MSRRRKLAAQQNQGTASKEPQASDVALSGDPASVGLWSKIPRWGQLLAASMCAIVGLLVIVMIVNRGGKSPSAKVEQARKMLQINRPRLAIEALAKEDSAEGHYLKAVALQAIGQHGAAHEQITEALGIAPAETKYQGYDLVLKLSSGKQAAVDELIKMYEVGKSSPGIAFFATRAFMQRKPPEIRSALQAFGLAVTLIDDTPEFSFSALHFAIDGLQQEAAGGKEESLTEKVATAERMLEKIEQVAPKDVDLLKELLTWAIRGKLADSAQRLLARISELKPNSPEITELKVMVELMLKRPEAAISAAQQAISEHPGEPTLDLMLAEATWQSTPSPEHEKILTDLVAKHPENPEFVAKLALYLTKSKRLKDAVAVVNQALSVTKGGEQRAALLKLAVGIPLEANEPVLAEQQVNRFKAEFHNSNIVDYFEGRVLFLKKDFPAAKLRFQKVLANQQISNESERMLASECLIWQQRILQLEFVNAKKAAATKAMDSTAPGTAKKVPAAGPANPPEKLPGKTTAEPSDKSKK